MATRIKNHRARRRRVEVKKKEQWRNITKRTLRSYREIWKQTCKAARRETTVTGTKDTDGQGIREGSRE